MRKLVCDCCGKEIDISYKNDGLGLKPKAHLTVFGKKGIDYVDSEEDLEYDLCQFCAEKVVDVIKMKFNLSPENS